MKEALEVLNDASGYIRSLLGKRLKARVTPNLKFVHDRSTMDGMRMSALVKQVRAEDERKKSEHGDNNDTPQDD